MKIDSELGLASKPEATSPERVTFTIGSFPENMPLAPTLQSHVVRLRRGEGVATDLNDETRIEVELLNVRDERQLKNPHSPWTRSEDAKIVKKRLAAPRVSKSLEKACFGDKVLARVAKIPSSRKEKLDDVELAPKHITLGAGAVAEGLETALMAMKPEELALITLSGEFRLSEATASLKDEQIKLSRRRNKTKEEEEVCYVARLDAIEKKKTQPSVEEAVQEARQLKERGRKLFLAGKPRRAEALWTRALRLFDECNLAGHDVRAREVEEELAVPLFLNLGQCARKRNCPVDEETLVTKAIIVKRNVAEDHAFRGKAYVRRAASRVDQGRWAAAKDDLRAAQEAATRQHDKPVLNDVRTQLRRVKDIRAAQHAADQKLLLKHRMPDSKQKNQEPRILVESLNPTSWSDPRNLPPPPAVKEEAVKEEEAATSSSEAATSSSSEAVNTSSSEAVKSSEEAATSSEEAAEDLRRKKKFPLLYEKEIDDRLKAQKPWVHDPDYDKDLKHAPRKPLEKLPDVLKEDDLEEHFKEFDKEDEEYGKLQNMVRQNWAMSNMYDTHGTGRRGMRPKGAHAGGGETFMSL